MERLWPILFLSLAASLTVNHELAQFEFQMTEPFSLVMSYRPGDFGSNIINPPNQTGLTLEVVIANPITACDPLVPGPDNTSYTGKAVLVVSACVFGVEVMNAQDAGAALVIMFNPYDLTPRGVLASQPATIPIIYIGAYDGITLYQSAMSNYTEVYIQGTGQIDPNDQAALLAIARSVDHHPETILEPNSGSNPPLNILLNDSTWDACIDRVGGLWCIGGRIVYFSCPDCVLSGPLSPAWGNLTALRFAELGPPNNFIGDMPCEFGNLVEMRYIDLSSNRLTSLTPCLGNWTNIDVVYLSDNLLTSLPSELTTQPSLRIFWADVNQLTQFPTLAVNGSLVELGLDLNAITSVPVFDELPINQLYLSDNLISEWAHETIEELIFLELVDLSNNSISGSLPALTNIQLLEYVFFGSNNFSGSIPLSWNLSSLVDLELQHNNIQSPLDLSLFPSLLIADLSYNQFTTDTGNPEDFGDFGSFLDTIPVNVSVLNLGHNKFSGAWATGQSDALLPMITKLQLPYNNLTQFPDDIFLYGYGTLTFLDLSHNNLTGTLPQYNLPLPTLQIADFSANPFLGPVTHLPIYAKRGTQFISADNTFFDCPILTPSDGYSVLLTVDPSYYNYDGCICEKGSYGDSPNCIHIPGVANVTSDMDSDNVSFSDIFYGSRRQQSGLDTVWEMSRLDNPDNVRMIEVNISVDMTSFQSESDSITLVEGHSDLLGTRVFVIRGNGVSPTLGMSDLQINESAWTVRVFASYASLNFRSRDIQGLHFNATARFYDGCIPSYVIFGIDRCRYFEPFAYSHALISLVYALVAIIGLMIVCVAVVLFVNRKLVIVKASSPVFCMLVLVGLLLMTLGSTTYVQSPENGDQVCNSRVWTTGLSVIIVLSSLLVKANRIKNLFGSFTLEVKKFTTQRLLTTVGGMVSVELIFLIALSAAQLSISKQVEGEGSDNNTYVQNWICTSQSTGWWVWFGFQLSYVAFFLFWGAYVAFYTKDTPTAFNESTHIMACLFILLFSMILLIPLNFIGTSPNGLAVVRSLGQLLVSLTLTCALFGPKLYYIAIGQGDDARMTDVTNSPHTSGLQVDYVPNADDYQGRRSNATGPSQDDYQGRRSNATGPSQVDDRPSTVAGGLVHSEITSPSVISEEA